eukprot:TRINITY_DN2102_c0_g1_i1.p1 TRINITY_DN2102_c0_g1~~TRINITY_DN2102_c0_g1_i1.p1  ORF type:complete len:386 (-),score=156.81 TRINITY_DN2102_c0_g1_i1:250-1407(-)
MKLWKKKSKPKKTKGSSSSNGASSSGWREGPKKNKGYQKKNVVYEDGEFYEVEEDDNVGFNNASSGNTTEKKHDAFLESIDITDEKIEMLEAKIDDLERIGDDYYGEEDDEEVDRLMDQTMSLKNQVRNHIVDLETKFANNQSTMKNPMYLQMEQNMLYGLKHRFTKCIQNFSEVQQLFQGKQNKMNSAVRGVYQNDIDSFSINSNKKTPVVSSVHNFNADPNNIDLDDVKPLINDHGSQYYDQDTYDPDTAEYVPFDASNHDSLQSQVLELEKAKLSSQFIKEQHIEMQELEKSIIELQQMFVDMAAIVQHQDTFLGTIEANVQRTTQLTASALPQLELAEQHRMSSRKKKLIIAGIIIGVAIVITIVVICVIAGICVAAGVVS